MDRRMMAKELLVLARAMLGYARMPVDPGVELRKDITPVLKSTLGLEGNETRANPKFSKFLLYTDSKAFGGASDSNKFHYFAIYQKADGRFVGGNAWGALGYPATYRAMELGRGDLGDLRTVESAVLTKIRAKLSKGYEETRFAA